MKNVHHLGFPTML